MNTGNYNYFKIIVSAWLWGLLSGTGATAQDYIFDVDMINVEDGLPHRNTHALTQDKDGFIWVSTLAGISRYDGYNFKTYNNAALYIPETDAARHLAIDHANRLWYSGYAHHVGKYAFAGIINSSRDSIYNMEAVCKGLFKSKDVIYVGNSEAAGDDVIVITRNGVVYRYNGAFTAIYRSPYPFSDFVSCEALPDGSYWLTHDKEVMRIKNGKRLQTFAVDYKIQKIISTYQGLILELSDFFFPPFKYQKLENGEFIPFSLPGHRPEDIRGLLRLHRDYSCYITKDRILVQDKQGNIYYTFDQLSDLNNEGFIGCYDILLDRQGILWGTTMDGLLKIKGSRNPFKRIGPEYSVRAIYRDGEQLWIDNNVKHTRAGVWKKIWTDPFYFPNSFYKDRQERLWITSGQKLLVSYSTAEDSYTRYVFDDLHILRFFQNILTQHHWLGTATGVFRFDPETRQITPFPLPIASGEAYIRQFYQNKAGIWIVSNKGIFLMDAEEERIVKHYTTANGLPFDNLNHLCEDSEGIFWMGAKGGGLIRWDIKNNTFRQYTRENGLSNNNIYAVYEDDYGILWMPSDYGLMAFDKTTETTRVYLPQHGIPHEEFNTFSHFRDNDGTLYFGGLKGAIRFHPADLRQQTAVSPPLYATKIQVLENNAEAFTDKTAAYRNTKNIRLNTHDKILEVELTLLDYEKSAGNQYAYKLTGEQEQWIYTSDNKLSIINPPYGTYNLVIRARGASGQWSESMLTIPVYMPYPFYMQWWFILTAVIVLVIAVFGIIRWRVRKLKRDRKHLEAEVQKRTWQIEQDKKTIEAQAEALKTLDKAKSRFFTNITHEFRTPLTLINGPAEQMIAAGIPKPFKTQAQTIKRNARQLLSLINQLLDISKLESGQMGIKTTTADIVASTRELVQVFTSRAAEKQQQLRFYSALESWKTHFDPEKLSDIVYNLLSNALKYSPEKAVIELSLSKTEIDAKEHIKIKVKDTGTGITPEALPHIFDRFYQVDDSTTRKGEGTGIGLALVKELVELMNGKITVKSHPGKGSVFTVSLPVLPAPERPDTVDEIIFPEIPVTAPETGAAAGEDHDDAIPGVQKLELLIIEDHAEMRTYIRSCVDETVYHVTEAANGAEGIEKAQQIIPDLIISDVMMPEKDGFEVTRAIRDHLATSHIPLILLTAKASEESRLKGIDRGADAYLTKPFSPKELSLRIKKLIELRKRIQLRYQDQNRESLQAGPVFQKEDRFINELKQYISENISEPHLSTTHLGSHFAMSRMQLHRKLKSLTNTSVGDFVRAVRLSTALELLKAQELNIAEIAYETGFSTPSNFSKAFKKVYGKTPSEFRE